MKPLYFGGHLVGMIKEDNTFLTWRSERHIFRRYNGLGISYYVLHKLKGENVNKITILVAMDDGLVEKYITSVETFLRLGIIYTDKLDNQRILPFSVLNQEFMKQYLEGEA
jgi:hypothetical protein